MLLAEYTSQNSQEAISVATGEGPSNLNAAASDKSPQLLHLLHWHNSLPMDLQRVGNAYWTRLQPWVRRWQKAIIQMQSLLDEAVEGLATTSYKLRMRSHEEICWKYVRMEMQRGSPWLLWGRLRQRTICQGNHYDSDRSTVLSVHISVSPGSISVN